jgi:hypothetical protein
MGYAGVFAAHISKHWPGISKPLGEIMAASAASGEECKIPSVLNRGIRPAVLHSMRWRPQAFRQRVFGVCHSGWSGLKSPQSVARMVGFLSSRVDAETAGGMRIDNPSYATGATDLDEMSHMRGEAYASVSRD